jgi:hypothetical protein
VNLIELELRVSFINVDYMVVVINSKSARKGLRWKVEMRKGVRTENRFAKSFPQGPKTHFNTHFSQLALRLLSRPAKDDFPNKYRIPF